MLKTIQILHKLNKKMLNFTSEDIKEAIAELEEIDNLERKINLSPYDTMSVYLVGDINDVIKG